MKNKILVSSIMVILFSSILGFQVSGEMSYLTDISSQPILSSTEPYFENVVYITWDATNYKALEDLIDDGTLVNTKKIDQIGYRQTIKITSHRTSTNPGMATLESGYGAEITLIPYNMFGSGTIKQSIPDGYCIAERLKVAFGSDVKTGHFFSWSYHQIDETYMAQSGNNTDPIFENITPGLESDYWYAAENLTWTPEDTESREATLVPFDEGAQLYRSPLIKAEFLATKAAAWLENVTSERFYLRMHFTEPDQAGHGYGVVDPATGEYTPEYRQSLIVNDIGTGMIIDVLENAGIMDKTLFIIGTDHGMFAHSHDGAGWPEQIDIISTNTFIISNSSVMGPYNVPVNQRDIAPTILASMGVDLSTITPAYDGGEQTGITFWDFEDNDVPFIRSASYNYLGSTYEELTAESKLTDVFNISLSTFDWDNDLAGKLEVDGLNFTSVGSRWSNVWFSNIDLSELKNGEKTFLFTVTDQFGNIGTYEIVANLKQASLSMWLSISGFLVIGSYLVLKRRKK